VLVYDNSDFSVPFRGVAECHQGAAYFLAHPLPEWLAQLKWRRHRKRALYCKAVHIGSEPVIELFKGQIAWDGVVEIFDLIGHPKAKRC
jgi:hypothetical protein